MTDSSAAQGRRGPVTMATAAKFEANGQYALAEIARKYAVDRPHAGTAEKVAAVLLFSLAALALGFGIGTWIASPSSQGVGFVVMLVVASALAGAGIGVWRDR